MYNEEEYRQHYNLVMLWILFKFTLVIETSVHTLNNCDETLLSKHCELVCTPQINFDN